MYNIQQITMKFNLERHGGLLERFFQINMLRKIGKKINLVHIYKLSIVQKEFQYKCMLHLHIHTKSNVKKKKKKKLVSQFGLPDFHLQVLQSKSPHPSQHGDTYE